MFDQYNGITKPVIMYYPVSHFLQCINALAPFALQFTLSVLMGTPDAILINKYSAIKCPIFSTTKTTLEEVVCERRLDEVLKFVSHAALCCWLLFLMATQLLRVFRSLYLRQVVPLTWPELPAHLDSTPQADSLTSVWELSPALPFFLQYGQ